MSITAAQGFSAGTASTGLRAGGADDVTVITSTPGAAAAGVFTRNQMAAPPIAQCRTALADGTLTAMVVNAGNANACTGAQGHEDAHAMATVAAAELGIAPQDVAVVSTGVIGVPMPMDSITPAISVAASSLEDDGGPSAARAIMTTDTVPKEALVTVEVEGVTYAVGGMAKGAGMIRPDMATTLAFITTDAPLTAEACRAALGSAVDDSFNRITVDGETSTNDCLLLLANGAAGGASIDVGSSGYQRVAAAIAEVATDLAKAVVRDGEGATTFIEIAVSGAADDAEAHIAAMAVADSVLFKCAVFGKDANWGRVVSAVGASAATVDPDRISVRFGGIEVADAGTAVGFDEDAAAAALEADELLVEVDLGVGDGTAVAWTCDLSYDYVRINADYRS